MNDEFFDSIILDIKYKFVYKIGFLNHRIEAFEPVNNYQ
jgi:hypothetical protein